MNNLMVIEMNMKIFCTLAIFLILVGISLQSVSAIQQNAISNITDTTQQTLNNASQVANQTAQDVNNFLDPIQSIINSINAIIQQIQGILSIFGGGQ
jgi:CHASE3 domain sensor protein